MAFAVRFWRGRVHFFCTGNGTWFCKRIPIGVLGTVLSRGFPEGIEHRKEDGGGRAGGNPGQTDVTFIEHGIDGMTGFLDVRYGMHMLGFKKMAVRV